MSQASLEGDIPPGALLLLDTATLLSHLKGREPASPVADHIIDDFVHTGRNPAIVAAISAMEILVGPMRAHDDTLQTQLLHFLHQSRNLKVVPVDFEAAQWAARCRASYGYKAPDALIIGTGLRNKAEILVSNDREWKTKTQASPLPCAVLYLQEYLPFP